MFGTITYNCYSKVKYDQYECKIYRSDKEYCTNIKSKRMVHKCSKYIAKSYPVNSTTTVYIKDDICYSHHYVERLSLIGMVFLILWWTIVSIIALLISGDNCPPAQSSIQLEMTSYKYSNISSPMHAINVHAVNAGAIV